jgi:fermentation-respiration switch protein FrsA (DUF1100 family)
LVDNNVTFYGAKFGLGGAVAAEIAKSFSPAALIIESSFTSIPDMAQKIYPFLPAKFLCTTKYDTLSKMKKIKCPVLVVHSREDEMIPFEMAEKIYNEANLPKQFLEIQGSHNEGYIASGEIYENGLKNFLENMDLN